MSGAQGAAAPRRLAALVRAAQRAAGVPNFAPVLLPGEQVCGSRCGSQYALPEAAAWVLGGRLTPQAVAAAAPGAAITIKRSPDPLFMYTEVGVPDRLKDGAGVGSRTEFVNMAPADFVRACQLQDGQNPPFHYYTAGVEQHAAGFAEKACPGWECLVVDERACNQRHAAPAHSSLWVGGNGSTTQAHYDVLHNVFVQVHGRKRFRLWGPEMHTPLRVFPDAHPRARKAQILIDDEANKVYVFMYVCMYVCMYACMHACTYTLYLRLYYIYICKCVCVCV